MAFECRVYHVGVFEAVGVGEFQLNEAKIGWEIGERILTKVGKLAQKSGKLAQSLCLETYTNNP